MLIGQPMRFLECTYINKKIIKGPNRSVNNFISEWFSMVTDLSKIGYTDDGQ